MGHNLDFSKGKAAFVSYQQKAWHGLGEIFTEPLTTEQALIRGGLDYLVLKLPNVHILPNRDEIISKNSFFTVRTDVNKVLGDKFGAKYEVIQNSEALSVVDEILQSGRATIETAGAIDEGKKAFICLKVDKSIIVGSNDKVDQYVLIANSHDGSLAITATPTNVRVVCNNTLTAALNGAKGAIKISHTSGAVDRLKEAAKVLNLISQNTEVNAENYNRMKETIISKTDMYNYFGNIFFSPEQMIELQKGNKDAIGTQKKNVLDEVVSFANNGIGQNLALNGGNLNMWFAYNAVTGYTTAKQYKSANDRAESMLFGSAANTIETAGVLALNPSKIVNLSGNRFDLGNQMN